MAKFTINKSVIIEAQSRHHAELFSPSSIIEEGWVFQPKTRRIDPGELESYASDRWQALLSTPGYNLKQGLICLVPDEADLPPMENVAWKQVIEVENFQPRPRICHLYSPAENWEVAVWDYTESAYLTGYRAQLVTIDYFGENRQLFKEVVSPLGVIPTETASHQKGVMGYAHRSVILDNGFPVL